MALTIRTVHNNTESDITLQPGTVVPAGESVNLHDTLSDSELDVLQSAIQPHVDNGDFTVEATIDLIAINTIGILLATTAQRDAQTVYEGMVVYNLDTHNLQVYNGTAWVNL